MSTRLEVVRQQLASHNEQERLTALSETLKYGQEGLDLLNAQSLKDTSETVQQSSYWILHGENPAVPDTIPSHLKPSPTDTITSVAITPDNNILVGGSWKKIWVWQLQTGEVSKSLEGHSHWVLSVAISPDGNTLVSGSADKTIKIWNLKTGKLIHTLSGHSSWVTAVAISPDGKTIVSGSADKTIKIWDLEEGQLRKSLTDKDNLSSVLSLCISHDGKVIVAGSTNNKITLWDLQNRTLIRTLEGHSDWVQALTISPDNKTLISGSREGCVKTWESKPEESSTKEAPAWQKGLIDIGASGIGFLCGGPIGLPVGLGALMIGRQIIHGLNNNNSDIQFPSQSLECTNSNSYYKQSINSIAYYFNSNLLILNLTKTIKSFDLKTNQIIYTLQQPKFISAIAISSNWEILVVAGQDWVILLNPKTGKPLHALKGCSYPKLSKIVISKVFKKLDFGESVAISVKGFDQNNQEISINNESINWQPRGGEIKKGLFIAGQCEGTFEIKAKVDIFEDSISITVREPSKITRIEITSSITTLEFGQPYKFKAEVRDQRGESMQETVSWNVKEGGTIDQEGNFTAGYTPGHFQVIASVGSLEPKSRTIKIKEPAKLQKLVFQSPVSRLEVGKRFQFQVKGIDQYGNDIPIGEITWSASSGKIYKHGTFYAGNIERSVIITATAGIDSQINNSIEIQVYEPSRLTTIQINPQSVTLQPGEDQNFHIVGFDQRGKQMSVSSGDIEWNSIPELINTSGYFCSSANQKGTWDITANVSGLEATATVTIQPVLRQIEIHPKEIELNPEEEFKFTVTGFDQAGDPIRVINPKWMPPKGGSITCQGVFKGNYKKREVVVTVRVGILNDTAKVTLRPVLRRLEITPKFVYLKSGEKQTFLVKGFDQFKKEIDLHDIFWETTDGQIEQDGTLTVPQDYQGYLKVTATSSFTPKHTEKVRTFLIYTGFFSRVISWLISHETLLNDILRLYFSSESTQQQLEPVKENDNSSNILLDEVQSTEIIPFNAELVTTDESSNIGNDDIIKSESSTDILDFSTVLGEWLGEKLKNLVARAFFSVSNFCLNEATANLSASADVFVLAVEHNPYKSFECLYILHAHSKFIPALAITPDGQKLISASWDNTIKIWNLNTRELLNTLEGHTDDVECLAISPDGTMLISGCWDKTLKIWSLNTNQLFDTLDFSNHVVSVAITSDGKKFISGERSNVITLWNLTTRQPLKSYGNDVTEEVPDHPFWWHKCLAVTPDQQKIAIGRRQFIQVYDLETGELLNNIESYVGWIYALAITPDGQKLIVGHHEMIKICDLTTKAPDVCMTLKSAAKEVYALAITPDGKQVVSAGLRINNKSKLEENISGSWIEIWDLNTGEKLHSIREAATSDNYVYCLAITPDGKQIISGYTDGTIKIWGVPELSLQVDDLEM